MNIQAFVSVYFVCSLTWTVVCGNYCELNQACSASFVDSDVQLIGCSTVQSNDVLMASLNCLNNAQCRAIIYNSSASLCSTCTGGQILSLTFNSLDTFYLKRRFMRLNMEYDPVTLSLSEIVVLPDRLAPSDVVYIKATILKYDNLKLDFLIDASNTYFHFRTWCNHSCTEYFNCTDAQCASGKSMILNSKLNKQWSTSAIPDSNYPFQLNQQFELHFLTQSGSVMCYINRKFYRSYVTALTVERVYGIRVHGTVNVHEFSV